MSKKRPPTDPPLSVRARKVPPSEDNGWMSEFAVFMTDLDGNVTVAEGKESDREIFRTGYNQKRNDDRRAAKTEQVRHHQTSVLGTQTISAEQNCIQKETKQVLRSALKRVLSTFDKTDPARSVLAYVLASGTNWEDSKSISNRLGITTQEVTTAKRKIQRRIKNKFPALQKHLGRTSGFQGEPDV